MLSLDVLRKQRNSNYFRGFEGIDGPTPLDLCIEQIEKIPIDYKNPKIKFFFAAAGHGTYAIVVYHKLMKSLSDIFTEVNQRHRHILENMLYLNDINPWLCNILQKEGFINVIQGNFIEYKTEMKFDVIIGNPPYQEDGATGDNKLYLRFISQSINLVKKDGFLSFITPKKGIENIILSGKNRNYFPKKKKILHLSLDTPAKYFNVGSSFCYFVIQNNDEHYCESSVEFINTENQIESKKINLYNFPKLPKHLDTKTLSILNKTVFYQNEKFELKTMLRPNGKNFFRIRKKQIDKGIVKKVNEGDFQFKIMDTLKLLGNTEYYLNFPLDAHNKMKVLLSKGGSVPCPFFDENGEYSASDNLLYLEVESVEDGQNFVNFVNSKLLTFLMNTLTKGSDMDFSWSISNIKKIPIKLLSDEQEIYSFYNLTLDEIEFIERSS